MPVALYPIRQSSNLEVHAHCYWNACRGLRHGDPLFAMSTLDMLRHSCERKVRERAEARLLIAGMAEPTPPEAA